LHSNIDIDELPPCLITIDKEGQWHHEGAEMIRRDFIRVFYQNMEMDVRGRYVIVWNGKRCRVGVADTAYVIWNVAYQDRGTEEPAGFRLVLSDDSQEDLAPETLWVGKDNVLYCRVKNQAFPARFNRAAYYSLAAHIEEKDNAFYLPLNGQWFEIKGAVK
jgi:uncharacterized protein